MVPHAAETPGIRLLRMLTTESGIETHLLHVADADGSHPARLLRAARVADEPKVLRVIAALDRVDADGLVRIHDVLSDEHGPSAIIDHVQGRSFADHLAARSRWAAGEAVAVLARLGSTVAAMHRAGVAFGGWGASSLVVAEEGIVLAEVTDAALFEPHAPEIVLAHVTEVAGDRELLRSLASDVLWRVDGSRAAEAHGLAQELVTVPGETVVTVLLGRLEELAAPVPLAETDRGVVPATAERPALHVADAPDTSPAVEHLSGARDLLARWVGPSLTDRVVDVLADLRARLSLVGGVLGAMPRARRVVLVGGAAAITTAGLLSAVVSSPAEQPEAPTPIRPPIEALTEPDHDGRAAGFPGDAGSSDPAEAALELLARREECFRELSMLCLETVDQSGSAALASDRAWMSQLQNGAEVERASVAPVAPRIIEQLGDSVLVELGPETAPASLLMMRSEAGWRIRDWVAWVPGS